MDGFCAITWELVGKIDVCVFFCLGNFQLRSDQVCPPDFCFDLDSTSVRCDHPMCAGKKHIKVAGEHMEKWSNRRFESGQTISSP